MNSIKNKIVAAYEELAEHYDRHIDTKPHNAFYDRPNTLAMLPEVAGKTILDAACGPGKYAEILLSQGASVTGFDISPKMVHLAKQRNGLQGDFFVHDFSQPLTQLEDQSFDMVLCALALHYVEDWSVTIREFYRVLKPGGKAVLQIKLREQGQPRHDPGVGGWLHRRTMLRMVFYTRRQMLQMLKRSGFREISIRNLREYEGFEKELDNGQIIITGKPGPVPAAAEQAIA